MERPRLLILGLDGATFDLLQPLIDEGRLPTLARLQREGVSGPLESTFPPISAAAWSSFATGVNPGKHGVVDFYYPRPGEYSINTMSATARTALPLWSLLGESGLSTGSIGVPGTYPPEPVNGFMVTGFLTPGPDSPYTWPPALKEELEEVLGGYSIWPEERYRSTPHLDRFVEDLQVHVDQQTEAALHLMRTREWDLFAVVYLHTDMFQHEVWSLLDPAHPAHDPALAARWRDVVLGFYTHLDASLGRILEGASEVVEASASSDTADVDKGLHTIVLSDHGFGPAVHFLLVNNWLRQQGYLVLKRSPATLLKRLAFRMGFTPLTAFRIANALGLGRLRRKVRWQRGGGWMKRLFLSLADVDWSRTQAWSVGSFGQIYINVAGERPHGIVQAGVEYDQLCAEIADKALEMRHPSTGEQVVERVYRKGEVYSGQHLDRTSDLILRTTGMRYLAFGHADFGSNRLVEPVQGMSGHHRPNGICLLHGPGVIPGDHLEAASILDIAPTALWLMGQPIPSDWDGDALSRAFSEGWRAVHPVMQAERATERDADDTAYSLEDEEAIRERLKGFGYAG
jgi:predicted AlkP superfamily phosphohydrolase/phosphomutase